MGIWRLQDEKGETPLHKIARTGMYDIARKGIDLYGADTVKMYADVNYQDKRGTSPIFLAAQYPTKGKPEGERAKVVQLLLDKGADVLMQNTTGWTVLHQAVSSQNVDAVNTILDHVRVKKEELCAVEDTSQRTALHLAAIGSSKEIVQALLRAGSDPMAKDNNGNTALSLAAKKGGEVNELLQKKAEDIAAKLVAASA